MRLYHELSENIKRNKNIEAIYLAATGVSKKGFIETLNTIEEAGVDVAGVSTDSHPQIKKYMREEQKDKKQHIDPWHFCKNVQK